MNDWRGFQVTQSVRASAIFFLAAEWWAGVTMILLHYALNLRAYSVGGDELGLPALWLVQVLWATPLLAGSFLVLFLVIRASGHSPQLWSWLLSLMFVGTPIAVGLGKQMAETLWRVNAGGLPWEQIIPPAVGLIVAYAFALLTDVIINKTSQKPG